MSTENGEEPQPPLPFEPPLDDVPAATAHEPMREVSLDAFSSQLFEEFRRRTEAVGGRDDRRALRAPRAA